ncbi:hypothetical protein [Methanosarcina sp. UBA5]|nr:hypothetical protein [Methanosarcina sp. UBA5]
MSVKVTVNEAFPEIGFAEKFATGNTVLVLGQLQLQQDYFLQAPWL